MESTRDVERRERRGARDETVEEYEADLATLIATAKSDLPGLPVFLIGHSAGGVSAIYTLNHQSELAGFICESFAFEVYALVRADERLEREFPSITIPVLILHGKADIAPRHDGSQLYFDTVGSKDETLKLYDDAFHDLLADTIEDEVFADVLGWIEARLPA